MGAEVRRLPGGVLQGRHGSTGMRRWHPSIRVWRIDSIDSGHRTLPGEERAVDPTAIGTQADR